MPGIFASNNEVTDIYVGNTKVKKVYVGTSLVYPVSAFSTASAVTGTVISSGSRMAVLLHNGEYAAADWGGKCIKIFNPDGTLKLSFGGRGSGNGKFQNPYGICEDPDGYLYVTDYKGQNSTYYLQKLSYDGSQVSFVSQLAVPGGGHQISYNSARNCLIVNAYGAGKVIQVPLDMSSYTQLTTAYLCVGSAMSSDGKILYYSTYSNGISKATYNTSLDTTAASTSTVVAGSGNGKTQGLALSDDDSYLVYVNNANKCINKVDLSNRTVTTLVSDTVAFSIFNNGGNRFTWLGGPSDSTAIYRLDL